MTRAVDYPLDPRVQHVRAEAASAMGCASVEWTHGLAVTFLQLACGILFITAVFVFLKAIRNPSHRRQFYWPIIFSNFLAGCSYWAISQDQGWVISHGCRQFFYARYFDWFFSLPLLLGVVALVAGAEIADGCAAMGSAALMTVCFAIGGISYDTVTRWLWCLFGVGWLALILYMLATHFKDAAASPSRNMEGFALYSRLSTLLMGCLCVYPLVWLFAEGFHSFSLTFEVVCYAVLDLLVRVLFAVYVILAGTTIDSCSTGYEPVTA